MQKTIIPKIKEGHLELEEVDVGKVDYTEVDIDLGERIVRPLLSRFVEGGEASLVINHNHFKVYSINTLPVAILEEPVYYSPNSVFARWGSSSFPPQRYTIIGRMEDIMRFEEHYHKFEQ